MALCIFRIRQFASKWPALRNSNSQKDRWGKGYRRRGGAELRSHPTLYVVGEKNGKPGYLKIHILITFFRAGEPANFLAAPAPDFFKRLRHLIFFPNGSGSSSWYFFQAAPAPAPRGQKKRFWVLTMCKIFFYPTN